MSSCSFPSSRSPDPRRFVHENLHQEKRGRPPARVPLCTPSVGRRWNIAPPPPMRFRQQVRKGIKKKHGGELLAIGQLVPHTEHLDVKTKGRSVTHPGKL